MRARRLAAAIGYVGTEIAKETPSYAGAFGAALVSESVSANDALIFLGGANLGAAAYEYGLARLTGAFLRRRDACAYASFENDWQPREYLAEYYSAVQPDERRTIAFFVDAMRDADPNEPVLVFGVGPTLHHVFLAAGKSAEIHLGDYLATNLSEIRHWIERDSRPTTGVPSSATRCNARACLRPRGMTSHGVRTSPGLASRNCCRSTCGAPIPAAGRTSGPTQR